MKTEKQIRDVIQSIYAGLTSLPIKDKKIGLLLVAVSFVTALEWVVEDKKRETLKLDEALKDLADFIRRTAGNDSPGAG